MSSSRTKRRPIARTKRTRPILRIAQRWESRLFDGMRRVGALTVFQERLVRELDIGRKAQIARLSSVDILTRPAIFRRYSLVLLSLRLNMLFSLDILGHL